MANGAILVTGFFLVWAGATLSGGWPPNVALALGAAAALLGGVVAGRMAALDDEGAGHFRNVLRAVFLGLTRFPGAVFAAFGVIAAALGFRRNRAGFVRLTLKPQNGAALVSIVEAISAVPGLVAVDADAGSVLVHALDEARTDAAKLATIARRASGGARNRVS